MKYIHLTIHIDRPPQHLHINPAPQTSLIIRYNTIIPGILQYWLSLMASILQLPKTLFCRFKVKESLNLTKIDQDPEVKHWQKTIEPLIQSPGLSRSFWGKIKENPCQAIFIAGKHIKPTSLDTLADPNAYRHLYLEWHTPQDFLDFKSSFSFETLFLGLSTIEQPLFYELENFRRVGRYGNWPCEGVAINTIYFPAPVTDEVRDYVYDMRGTEAQAGTNTPNRWYKGLPDGTWKIGTEERSGIWMNTFIYFHYWRSPELEQKYKEVSYEGQKALKNWETNLEYAGAVEITEEHCDLSYMR